MQLDMWNTVVPPRRDDDRAKKAKRTSRPSIDARFAAFTQTNPHVMVEMLRLARAHLVAGAKRIGAKALWEELRQSLRVQKLGDWKLDNSFTALAARRLIELEPALASVIEIRRRKS